MATWTFNNVSPKDLGIGLPVIERHNQARDVCRVKVNRNIDIDPPWEHGERVVVKRDGNQVFTGYAQAASLNGAASEESHAIEIFGPWWNMERLIFTQVALDSELAAVSDPTPEQISGRRRLFVGAIDGLPMTTRAMLQEVLFHARLKGAIVNWDGIQEVDDGVYPEPEEAVDRSVAEIIRTILSYHLDVATYFDGAETLRLKKRTSPRESFALGSPPLVSCKVKLRRDLIPEGVYIRYEQRRANASPGGYKDLVGFDLWPLNAVPGEIGMITETVQLEPEEPIPAGVAKQFYLTLSSPPIVEGELEFTEEECGTGLHPGSTVKVSRPGRALQVRDGFVQSVVEDIANGGTTVTFGLPKHLGLDEFIDLMRRKQRRHRDDNVGDPPRIEVPSTALTPYLVTDERGRWVLRVSTGLVGDGNTDHVPTWESSSTPLDATVPPQALLAAGSAFNIYLKHEYTPHAMEYTVLDSVGSAILEFGFDDEGELDSVSVQFSNAGARAASVNPEGGAVVQGWFFRKIGRVEWPLGAALPTLSVSRTGNYDIMHRPPSRLSYIPTT